MNKCFFSDTTNFIESKLYIEWSLTKQTFFLWIGKTSTITGKILILDSLIWEDDFKVYFSETTEISLKWFLGGCGPLEKVPRWAELKKN